MTRPYLSNERADEMRTEAYGDGWPGSDLRAARRQNELMWLATWERCLGGYKPAEGYTISGRRRPPGRGPRFCSP